MKTKFHLTNKTDIFVACQYTDWLSDIRLSVSGFPVAVHPSVTDWYPVYG